jgi:hypothetical protein
MVEVQEKHAMKNVTWVISITLIYWHVMGKKAVLVIYTQKLLEHHTTAWDTNIHNRTSNMPCKVLAHSQQVYQYTWVFGLSGCQSWGKEWNSHLMKIIFICLYLAGASEHSIGTFLYLKIFILYLADLGTIHIFINIDQYNISIKWPRNLYMNAWNKTE